MKAKELGLGDQITLFKDGGYNTCTVYKIIDGEVHLWRPYIHTSAVVYSGPSVIPYIGLDDFSISPDTTVELVRKNPDHLL